MTSFNIAYSSETLAVALAIGGAIALIIAILYVKDKNNSLYKPLVAVGFIVGLVLAFICFTTHRMLETYTLIFVALAAFTLIIRPFRDIHFAMIFSILVMLLVYILLGDLQGGSLDVIGQGWGRVIVAVIAGAMVYMITNFVETLVKIVGKLLNWWPVLMVLGILCIIEAAAVYAGYSSIINWFS